MLHFFIRAAVGHEIYRAQNDARSLFGGRGSGAGPDAPGGGQIPIINLHDGGGDCVGEHPLHALRHAGAFAAKRQSRRDDGHVQSVYRPAADCRLQSAGICLETFSPERTHERTGIGRREHGTGCRADVAGGKLQKERH